VTTPFDRSTPVSFRRLLRADLVARTVTEISRFQGGPEAVSTIPSRHGPEATTLSDRSTPVFYWSSMHADLVSRTVTEISRFEGGPEGVSGLR
jgi:hypothetical protein